MVGNGLKYVVETESKFFHWKNFFRLAKPCRCGNREIIKEQVETEIKGENKKWQGPARIYCSNCINDMHRDSSRNKLNRIQTPLYYILEASAIIGGTVAGWYSIGKVLEGM